MNIVVIQGSPTGSGSITLQYVKYAQQRFAEHNFNIIDVGRGVRRLERDREHFDSIVAQMAAADGIIWSFPVYTFLTPAALVRFVELLCERVTDGCLAGKVATILTTSEHFFDHTAHSYIEAISEDLGLSVFKGFSAAMEEILVESGRRSLEGFMRQFFRLIETRAPLEEHYLPVMWQAPDYVPRLEASCEKTGSLRVSVVTDSEPGDSNLERMIEVFCAHVKHPVDVVNLRQIGMKGGCLGCLQCVYDGSCVYKDNFAEAFDARIRSADVLVFAGRIRYRYLSSLFKAYFDRNFRNGHRPVLHGKPMGWLISGPLRQLGNLRQILEAKAEVQHSHRLGIVTDEYADSEAISLRIVELAQAIEQWHDEAWIRPATFLGVGGRKIFRDLMYTMRGIVRADHLYYRRKGLYDFPQKDLRRTVFNWWMTLLMAIPASRNWVLRGMNSLKIAPFRKLLARQTPRSQ